MKYDFKKLEELGWAAAVAAAVFLLQVAAEFDPETILDWHLWVTSTGAGLVRYVAAAVLARTRSAP